MKQLRGEKALTVRGKVYKAPTVACTVIKKRGPQKFERARCPKCGLTDVYYRSKTRDFVCKKCGEVFTAVI